MYNHKNGSITEYCGNEAVFIRFPGNPEAEGYVHQPTLGDS